MEGVRKRKKTEKAEIHGGGGRRKKEREMEKEVGAGESVAPPPTDEEVEEFFAILRRMRVAVKYFENTNGGDGRQLTEKLDTALETEVVSVSRAGDDVKVSEKSPNGVVANCVLDLNAVPEGDNETNSV